MKKILILLGVGCLFLETTKISATRQCCYFKMRYLSEQFKSTELHRGRKPCTSRRERKCAPIHGDWETSISAMFQHVLPVLRGCSFQGPGSPP